MRYWWNDVNGINEPGTRLAQSRQMEEELELCKVKFQFSILTEI